MDFKAFNQAIQQIADEKGIEKSDVIDTIELAMAAAYKRDYGKRGQIVKATLDPETGSVSVRQIKIVMDEAMIKPEEEIEEIDSESDTAKSGEKNEATRAVREESSNEDTEDMRVRFNPEKHIMLHEAKKIKKDVAPEDELEFPLEYHDEFGRIAAQTAKQVIIQRIRETERETIYNKFKDKEGELASGIVQRIEGRNIFVDIGQAAAVLPPDEQVIHDRYRVGDRIKALIGLVERSSRGPGVFLSRAHPRLLHKLFEMEVPEIAAESVEIKAIAREAGSRSKIAVLSHEDGVDPVGSLVGQKGVRVSTVIHELNGEKIDVVEWSDDAPTFIANALSPARVLDVELYEEHKNARVMVAQDQLSLAIGKGGQNVRLAAKLTGWKIDVRGAQDAQEDTAEAGIQE